MPIDYSVLDQPAILRSVFYPRDDSTPCPENAFDLSVTVEGGASVSSRFYVGHPQWSWVLFFHGNGEGVSDYDEIAPLYHRIRLNLAVSDYRGYGTSTGVPTLTHLVRDCHVIFREVRGELVRRSLRPDLWVMGRSLGSISALELGHGHQEAVNGLIIESGFPSVSRIMTHLGTPAPGDELERIDRQCLEMIREIFLPCLIIHGEADTLVPLRNAKDLYENLGSREKRLLVIPSADHNDVLMVGFKDYFEALRQMTQRRAGSTKSQG